MLSLGNATTDIARMLVDDHQRDLRVNARRARLRRRLRRIPTDARP